MSSISPVYGPLDRSNPARDIAELFKRVEDLHEAGFTFEQLMDIWNNKDKQ